MTTPITTSPRLLLIPLDPSNDAHCDFIVTLYNTPLFIAHLADGKPTSITTREASRKYIQNRFLAEYERNGYGTYLLALKNPPQSSSSSHQNSDPTTPAASSSLPPDEDREPVYIGTTSLSLGPQSQPPPNNTNPTIPDLGFAILPSYTRQGYAVEASRALLSWAEREHAVKEVLGLFDPANEGSKAVFRRLGWVDRGERVLKGFGGTVGAAWVKPEMGDGELEGWGL